MFAVGRFLKSQRGVSYIVLRHTVLPEGVLVTDGDRRENDGVVVVDLDVDSHRPRQEVRHTADDLNAEQHAAAEEDDEPQ